MSAESRGVATAVGVHDESLKPVLAVTLGDARGIGPEEVTGHWHRGATFADAGRFAGRAIERAVALALEGKVDGIVTAPIDKAALLAGGYHYPGHTEML